jgi:hypothetical protein
MGWFDGREGFRMVHDHVGDTDLLAALVVEGEE